MRFNHPSPASTTRSGHWQTSPYRSAPTSIPWKDSQRIWLCSSINSNLPTFTRMYPSDLRGCSNAFQHSFQFVFPGGTNQSLPLSTLSSQCSLDIPEPVIGRMAIQVVRPLRVAVLAGEPFIRSLPECHQHIRMHPSDLRGCSNAPIFHPFQSAFSRYP